MKIDFHTHIFPDKIASRAIETLSHKSGGLEPSYDGTAEGLKKRMEKENVDISVVLSIATNAHQMHSVNDFAASVNNGKIIAFGSVFPDAPDCIEELGRIKKLGLKGVKFHPEYQDFYVDEEKMRPIYEEISRLGLITVFHSGADLGYSAPYHCPPERAVKALKMFTSPVVFAHWGGWLFWKEVYDSLAGTEAYFDVSFGYGALPREYAMIIIKKHGADKLLLGSDGPWHTVGMETRFLETLQLTEEEKEKIYYKNAKELLGI